MCVEVEECMHQSLIQQITNDKESKESKEEERGKYKSYKSEEEQIKFRNAIEEFNRLQSTNRNANLQAFAKEHSIGYKRIQPFCCKDPSKREAFVRSVADLPHKMTSLLFSEE